MSGENNISVPFHWSGSVRAITAIAVVSFMATGFYLESKIWPAEMLWLKYLLIIILSATVIIGLGYMPIRLKANEEKITVSRLFGSLEIPMDRIIESRMILKSEMDDAIRTFGSGGLFGYLGLFRSTGLGNFTMYATDLNHLLLIRTSNKKYVFSCSRSKELVDYINLRLKQNNEAR